MVLYWCAWWVQIEKENTRLCVFVCMCVCVCGAPASRGFRGMVSTDQSCPPRCGCVQSVMTWWAVPAAAAVTKSKGAHRAYVMLSCKPQVLLLAQRIYGTRNTHTGSAPRRQCLMIRECACTDLGDGRRYFDHIPGLLWRPVGWW